MSRKLDLDNLAKAKLKLDTAEVPDDVKVVAYPAGLVQAIICAFDEALKLLDAAKCPNAGCWDGSIPDEVSEGVWEAQQCQWCAEKKKLLDEHL